MILGARPLTVTRAAPETRLNGDIIPGATTPIVVNANVQPLRGWEMNNYPEGDRSRRAIEVYADAELRAGDERTGQVPDLLSYDGDTFEVRRVDDWSGTPLPHWRAVAFRVDPPPS